MDRPNTFDCFFANVTCDSLDLELQVVISLKFCSIS